MGKNGFEYGVLPFPGANGISPSRKHILHVIISTFWIIGMILTAQNIHKNYSRYLDYPKIVQTKEEHGVNKTFPIILLCSNSMHSKEKLSHYKGNNHVNFTAGTINQTIIEALYGRYRVLDGKSKAEWVIRVESKFFRKTRVESDFWKMINRIDLADFIYETRPQYFVLDCRINDMNCRTLWRITKTTAGACLELDTKTVLERDKAMTIMQSDKSAKMKNLKNLKIPELEVPEKISLGLSVGFNASVYMLWSDIKHMRFFYDTTFGWHGFHDGFSVYYKHFTHVLEDQQHSVLLSPGLTPIFEFQNIERKMLGKPYSECVETYSANNYNDRREWDKYYQQTSCVFKALIREVMSACGCYPNYIDAMKVILVQIYQDRNATNADDLLNATRPCNFLEHAVCVSTIMDHFAIPKFKCLPACESHTFAPKSIQYVKTSQKRVKLMRSVLNLTDDIDITSMVVRLAEMPNYSITEIPQYSFEEWLSDVGGSAGLILGLNILQILSFSIGSAIRASKLFGRLSVRIKRKYDAIKRNRLQGRNYVSPAAKHRPTAIDVTVDLGRNSNETSTETTSSRRSFEQDDMLSYSYAEDPIVNYRL